VGYTLRFFFANTNKQRTTFLTDHIDFLIKNINDETKFILFKGKNVEEEIKFAEIYWNNKYWKKMKILPKFNFLNSFSNLNSKIVVCNFIKP